MSVRYKLPESRIGALGFEQLPGLEHRETVVVSLNPVSVKYTDSGDECPAQTEALITRAKSQAKDLQAIVDACSPEDRASLEAVGVTVEDAALISLTNTRIEAEILVLESLRSLGLM